MPRPRRLGSSSSLNRSLSRLSSSSSFSAQKPNSTRIYTCLIAGACLLFASVAFLQVHLLKAPHGSNLSPLENDNSDEELATQQWWKGDGSGVGNVGEYDPQTGKVKYVETHKLGRKMGTVQPSSDVEEGEGGDEDMDVADEMGEDGDDDEDSDQDGFDIDVDDRELEEGEEEEEADEVGDNDLGVEAGERSNSADGFKDVVEGMDNFEHVKKSPESGGKSVNNKSGEKKVTEEGRSVRNGGGSSVNSEKQPDLIARGQQQARTKLDDAKVTENVDSSSLTVPKWVLEPRMNSKMMSDDGHNGMSDILESVALGDLVKNLEKKKGSFYWDHALGVRKTTLENPLQGGGGGGELSGGGLMKNVGTVRNSLRGFKEVVEDWKERFNSDDELVDENVQRRLEDVKEIEDALQLNSDGGSFNKAMLSRSALKKSESQPKKVRLGTFDPMNPANIPMLQDPDTSPGTWMTKSDKEMLRAIRVDSMNIGGQLPPKVHLRGYTPNAQGKTTPAKFSTDVVGTALEEENYQDNRIMDKQDPKLRMRDSEGEAIGRKVGGTEQGRRMTPQAFNAPTLAQPAPKQIRSKVVNHLAINSQVNNSQVSLEVLDQFLAQGNCSLKVFMAWTTPGWGFTARHLRVLESLFRFHRNACVVVLSETIDIDYFKTFLKEGYKVTVVAPSLKDLLANTPANTFAPLLPKWRHTPLFYLHYTELLRLAALYKFGGIYMDLDVIVLKPLDALHNTLGSELATNGDLRLNGAILAFDKSSLFLKKCMEEFATTYNDTSTEWNGADLLTRVANSTLKEEGKSWREFPDLLNIEGPVSFFPLDSSDISKYFTAPKDGNQKQQQTELLMRISKEAYAVHLWSSLTSNLVPETDSLVGTILKHSCLHCTDNILAF